MRLRYILPFLLLGMHGAYGQGTGVNPPVGSLWTYLGATYGAGWVSPGQFVPPVKLIDDKTGAITSGMEGAILTAMSEPSPTAQMIADWALCNCTNTPYSYAALRGIAVDNGGQTMPLVNAVEGYAISKSEKGTIEGGFPTSVALFGIGIAEGNGSNIWGVNALVTDNKGQVVSSGTGKVVYGAEFDFNITSPNTGVTGVVLQGAALSQPVTSSGYSCGPLSFPESGIQWGSCFQSDSYVTPIAVNIGVEGSAGATGSYPPTPPAGRSSQFITWSYVDNGAPPAVQSVFSQVGLYPVNAGGFPSLVLNNASPTLAAGLHLTRGGFSTGDNNLVLNGMVLGTRAASGSSVSSQALVLKYFDNTGTTQNVSLSALGGANPVLGIATTGGGGIAAIQIGGNIGVSCSGAPTSLFVSVGGIVTHC